MTQTRATAENGVGSNYPRDLREFLSQLEACGRLYTFSEPIDKDTEIMPLLRVETRGLAESERSVLLFENPTNAEGKKYDMRVAAGVYGAAEDIVLLGMGCESWHDGLEKWHRCVSEPLAPVIVEKGPVHEVVHIGDELKAIGFDMLPVPLEEPGFSQVIRTGVPIITRDPETGITNVGTYNALLRDRDRAVVTINPKRDTNWLRYRKRGEEMPVAIVIGCTPNVMLAGSAAIPYGVDELTVASAIAGEGIPMVRCKTVPLEVPANAEIVIEGMVSTELFESSFGFAEYPGYVNMESTQRPVMRLTAITHRRNAIFTPVTVGFVPSDSSAIWNFCNSAVVYHRLKYEQGLPISDVYMPQMGGASHFVLVQLEADATTPSAEVMEAAAKAWPDAKYTILVDNDIDLRDHELLIWAMTFRVQPGRDVKMLEGRGVFLDPSVHPTGERLMGALGEATQHFRMTIDATRKWPYPPVALPRRDYMERALEIWRRHDLPEPKPRTPWFGYELGYWNDENQRLADLMVAGDYLAVGEFAKGLQQNAEQVFGSDRKQN